MDIWLKQYCSTKIGRTAASLTEVTETLRKATDENWSMVFCFFLDWQFEFIYVNLKCKVEYWQKAPTINSVW